MAPIFIAVYYLMAETEDPVYEVALVNLDQGADHGNDPVNLGDSIISYSMLVSGMEGMDLLKFSTPGNREQALQWLRTRKADVGYGPGRRMWQSYCLRISPWLYPAKGMYRDRRPGLNSSGM